MEQIADVVPLNAEAAVARIRAAQERSPGRTLPPGPVAEPPAPDTTPGPPPRVERRYRVPLDELEQTTAVVRARRWLDGPRDRGLLLAGPVGRGKSAIAGAVAVVYGAPVGAHYWPTGALVEARKAEMDRPSGPDGRTRASVEDRIARRQLLVLDDLGAERPTPFSADLLGRIISARYDAEQLLVVTTNLPPNRLLDHVGDRAFSRLCEMCELVEVDGADRRKASA